MTNAHTVNVALAFLTSTHNAEQDAINEIARLKEENAKLAQAGRQAKVSKKAKASGAQAAPIHHGATVFGVMMPDATYSEDMPQEGKVECAKSYLLSMRNAGKRQVDGKSVYQEREAHNDQIQAIAAFIGYDNRAMFGAQETAARMLAYRLLSKRDVMAGPDRETQSKVDHSAKGFVAGLPAPVAAKLADLQGREVIAAETMIAHQKDADNVGRSAQDRELSAALVLVEEERLSHIRADIKALTF